MAGRLTLTKGGELDYLTKRDGVVNCRQVMVLNESSILQFELSRKSRKWAYFEGSGLEVKANGRVYVILGEDGPTLSRKSGALRLPVKMKELWYKLTKKYVTAYNIDIAKSSEFDHIDQHMVVLLGNSNEALTVNGAKVQNPYAVGSAQYMFYALLYGTGWTLDSRFASMWPDGKFDIETDKKHVLDNLKLAQSLYGGMLLWDSENKRVALVDEKKYTAFDGFEARYGRNITGIERRCNSDIVTRLYPYGNAHLNIAAVNGGREYVENFSYTKEVFEGVLTHSDIYSQEFLLNWGRRELEKQCKPRYTYSVDMLLYGQSQNAALPRPQLGMLGLIVDQEVVGQPVSQRIIGIDQNVFDEHDAKVDIGDVQNTFEGTLKDLVDAGDKVNDTVSNNYRIPGIFVSGQTPAGAASDKRWEQVTGGIKNDIGGINSTVSDMKGNISTIQQTAEQISLRVSNAQGDISALQIRATGIETSVKNAQGDISSLRQTATSIETSVRNMRGDISTIQQTANKIQTRVSSLEGYTSTITQTANRVAVVVDSSNRINAASIVAAVNGSSSSVKISADHVQLSGYVTINALKGNGTTEINGANIKTGTIAANRISSDFSSVGGFMVGGIRLYNTMSFAYTSGQSCINHVRQGDQVRSLKINGYQVVIRYIRVNNTSYQFLCL